MSQIFGKTIKAEDISEDNITTTKEVELSAADMARTFGEDIPKVESGPDFKKMTSEELKNWEEAQDNSSDLYKIAARVKNLARGTMSLTAQGEQLCNIYTHVLKDFYTFAEGLPDNDTKTKLVELIRKHEDMCGQIISAAGAGRRK